MIRYRIESFKINKRYINMIDVDQIISFFKDNIFITLAVVFLFAFTFFIKTKINKSTSIQIGVRSKGDVVGGNKVIKK